MHHLSHLSSMSSSLNLKSWIQVWWPIFGIKKISQKNSHNLHQHHPQFTLNAEVKYRVTNYGHLWRAGVGTEAAERPDGRRWNTSFSKNARLVFESTHLSIILIIVVTFNIPMLKLSQHFIDSGSRTLSGSQFGQIHFIIWQKSFVNLDKYI